MRDCKCDTRDTAEKGILIQNVVFHIPWQEEGENEKRMRRRRILMLYFCLPLKSERRIHFDLLAATPFIHLVAQDCSSGQHTCSASDPSSTNSQSKFSGEILVSNHDCNLQTTLQEDCPLYTKPEAAHKSPKCVGTNIPNPKDKQQQSLILHRSRCSIV